MKQTVLICSTVLVLRFEKEGNTISNQSVKLKQSCLRGRQPIGSLIYSGLYFSFIFDTKSSDTGQGKVLEKNVSDKRVSLVGLS